MDEEKNGVNEDAISSNIEREGDKNLEYEDSNKDELENAEEVKNSQSDEIDKLEESDLVEKDKSKLINGSDENNNNKKKIGIIGIIIIVIIVFLSLTAKYVVSQYEDIVYPGISVYGNDLSKMNKEELNKELSIIESERDKKTISIQAKIKNYDIKLEEIIKDYNKEELANSVLEYGKDKSTIKKFFMICSKSNKDYKPSINIDQSSFETIISKIEEETNEKAKEPQIIIEKDNIQYKDGKEGISLDKDDIISQIQNVLNEMDNLESDIKIEAKYEKTSPKIGMNDLKKVDTKISEYSTYYGGGNGRGSNIENAASKIDNKLLIPGEEFSYEASIGPIVADNGYKTGSVIINGKIEDGIGGGVCQVSSTLYNAQLKAGILPTQRRNHSKAVDYVPRGLDATLATGLIDYKFKNTYDYPLVINSYTSKGKVYTEIWSNKDATKGINYEAVGYASGNKADTYLYGYNKEGKKVYEKHIDTSIYK